MSDFGVIYIMACIDRQNQVCKDGAERHAHEMQCSLMGVPIYVSIHGFILIHQDNSCANFPK